MPIDIVETRRRSAALFGNEKVVEVVLSLNDVPEPRSATAQQIMEATGIGHSMVRDVLQRLTGAGALHALPKVGGSRSAQYYRPDGDVWESLVGLCRWTVVGDVPLAEPRRPTNRP
jgi:hypothetical protein